MFTFFEPIPAPKQFCCDDCWRDIPEGELVIPYSYSNSNGNIIACMRCAAARKNNVKPRTEPKDAGVTIGSRPPNWTDRNEARMRRKAENKKRKKS